MKPKAITLDLARFTSDTRWDEIPGARGCTPHSCGFRDHNAELAELGLRVAGVSAQSVEDQLHVLGRGALPIRVLDPQHELAAAAAREKPVVQCRPRAADVQHAGWRRRETYPHRQRC